MSARLSRHVASAAAGAALVLASAAPALAHVPSFRPYAASLIDRLVVGTERLNEAVQAGNLEEAQQAWIHARYGWERGETFLGAVFPSYDKRIDFWPDAEQGFHGVEPILFEQEDVGAAEAMTAELTEAVHELEDEFQQTDLSRQVLLNGTAGIAFEIGAAKAGGGESPFSGTSLQDMQNNLVGIETAYALVFAPTLRSEAPGLHEQIVGQTIALGRELRVESVDALDQEEVVDLSERLAISFQEAADELGLKKPQIGG